MWSFRLKEQTAEQLSSMKAEHLRVLDQMHATYALEHSASKVAELTNELSAQEVLDHQQSSFLSFIYFLLI